MKKYFFSFRFRISLIAVSLIGFIFFTTHSVQAIPVAVVADAPRSISAMLQAVKDAIVKVGKVTFLNSLRSLVNQFAYDTATYLGSGGQGQKPVYFTQEFGPWLRDQVFNVGGQFIEEFAQTPEGEFIDKYDVCSPDLSVTIKISLGLTNYANQSRGLKESRCNLKKIYEQGRNSVDDYLQPDYLKNLAITAFEPETTDVGIATTLFDQLEYKQLTEKESLGLGRLESEGWIPETTTIAKALRAPPANQKSKLEQARQLQTQNFFTQTGDIFVDAANIFLNQLALSAFNKLIDNLSRSNNQGSGSGSNSYYSQGNTGGMTEVSRRNSAILQARFNERADYNILSELSSCSDENKAGPTNCVISEQFAQAISENITVAEAINRHIIDPKKRLGFNAQGGNLSYLDGYPYRSLIILRKYRILPVGWEVAAQYIKDNPSATKDVTIGDLINCFAPGDSYVGLNEEWCEGLIDPNWVLKVPKQYCGMEGYGPEIVQDQLATSTVGYCTAVGNANCDPRSNNSADCATNYVTCFRNEECTNYTGFTECNFSIRQEHQIVRDDTYCADEQGCIKENSNGSCAYYGYCTEEKRRWVFNQEEDNSCEPRNNTCQTFKNDTGQQASFLENTLDYNNCDANQVGCKQYALQGPYDAATKKITWDDTGKQAFFNKNASECDPTKENCHQFIRVKDGLDANLIADGSFEESSCIDTGGGICDIATFTTVGLNNLPSPNNRWYILVNGGTVKAGIVNTKADSGSQSLYIEGEGGLFSQEAGGPYGIYSILPDTFVMEDGHYYTISARVFVEQGIAYTGFGYSGPGHVESTVTNQWQTIRATFYKAAGSPTTNYFVSGRTPSTKFYIDNIKLTVGRAATDYSEYGDNTTIYQKLLPNYLASTCYVTGGREPYTPKDNAPDECKQFARRCNDSEVGCESFTSLDSGLNITAKITVPDYCPSSCVGYNTFVQQPNAFNPRQAFYFIPATARRCSAQAVGCTAFTNLDKLDQGGEAIEYYTAMRKCIKPDPTKCLPFYTWEGSDESGYQLKVFSLQKDPGSRLGDEPLSTMPTAEESLLCNASIFIKLPTDPGYNYDCRQFYAQDGTVSYHLLEKTITCSDDCHPYRRELTTAATCIVAGGDWDATQNRCLYYAIPGEGRQCAASDAGCSEYTGNIANNTRNVFNPSISTFEQTTTPPFDGWFNVGVGSLWLSNASLNLGGHSLTGSTGIAKVVGADVHQNKSYNLTFLARSAVGVSTLIDKVELINENADSANFGVTGMTITTDWKLYSFNLSNLDHIVSPAPDGNNPTHTGEKIRLLFNDEVFIDNLKLTEIPNRYYLIKNSWVTPTECDQDFSGAASGGYMLGCSQYKKTDNSRVNLRSFTDLCSDSSAGCEAMVDTHNSDDYKQSIINDDNNDGIVDPTDHNGVCDPGEVGCIETPEDTMINVIFDPTKQCGAENKGCQRVGKATTYDGVKTFSDVYIKNNPDRYNTTVCTAQGVGCSKWTSPDGDAYFKDPGDEVCEWRLKQGTVSDYHWYKKKVKRCGGSGSGTLCSNDSQCGSGITCQLVNTDLDCGVTTHKTLGEGGQKVIQPSTWAGLCENTQAGCTELLDPVSTFNASLIRNSSYQPNSSGSGPDFWDEITDIGGSPGGVAVQSTILNLHTTYILKGNDTCTYDNGRGSCNPDDEVYIRDCTINNGAVGEIAEIYQLDASDNLFKLITNSYDGTDVTSGSDRSLEFYITSDRPFSSNATSISCSVWRKNRTTGKTIQLREAAVGYQLRQNLDTQSPNGLASFNKGYILFNQRIQSGNKKLPLLFNADETGDGGTDGTTPKTRSRPWNANVIVKVKADRTCSKWLDCSSYIPDPNDPHKQTCLEVGLCDSLNSEGQCDHFIDPNTTKNQNINNLGDVGQISNMTGYSKVGYYRSLTGRGGIYSTSLLGDDYNLANMKQVGETVDIINGDFEYAEQSPDNNWTGSLSIIIQPQLVTKEGLKSLHSIKNRNAGSNSILPPSGAGLAKLDAGQTATQGNFLNFEPGKTYALSAYVYVKSGIGKIDLLNNGTSALTILQVDSGRDPNNQWVRKTGVFKIPPGSNFNIQLIADAGGEVYFDKIAIESALNTRCENQDQTQTACTTQNYTASTCRLFPTEDALSCTHFDSSSTEHRGLKGYCLEYDPNFPETCLLWYPLDKIASDQTEEGLGLTLPARMYYCLETEAECLGSPTYSIVAPEFNSTSVPGYNVAANTNWVYDDFRPSQPQDQRYYYNPNSGPIGGTGGPDKPSYTCKKVAEISSVDKKYWRTRLVDTSSYKIDQKAAQKIFFNDFAGNEVTTHYDSSNYFGYFGNLGGVLKRYIQAPDLGLGGIPYVNDHNLTCSGFLRLHQDAGDNCNVHERANMGFWQTCSVTNEVTPTYGCDVCGYCPFDPSNSGISAKATKTVDGWIVQDQDAGRTQSGGTNYTQNYVSCSSEAKVTYNGAKSTDPQKDLLASIFVETSNILSRSGSGYITSGTNLSVPTNQCGTGGTTMYPSFCTGDPSKSCTSIANCIGKGVCFMRRASISSSGSFNYTTDYCYIPPTVYDLTINGLTNQLVVTDGSKAVTFAFKTKTDPDQLPLKHIDIDLGYKECSGCIANKIFSMPPGDYGDLLRNMKTILQYVTIYTNDPGKCASANAVVGSTGISCGSKPCCVVKPKVMIKDNWGKCNSSGGVCGFSPTNGYIRVDQN